MAARCIAGGCLSWDRGHLVYTVWAKHFYIKVVTPCNHALRLFVKNETRSFKPLFHWMPQKLERIVGWNISCLFLRKWNYDCVLPSSSKEKQAGIILRNYVLRKWTHHMKSWEYKCGNFGWRDVEQCCKESVPSEMIWGIWLSNILLREISLNKCNNKL